MTIHNAVQQSRGMVEAARIKLEIRKTHKQMDSPQFSIHMFISHSDTTRIGIVNEGM